MVQITKNTFTLKLPGKDFIYLTETEAKDIYTQLKPYFDDSNTDYKELIDKYKVIVPTVTLTQSAFPEDHPCTHCSNNSANGGSGTCCCSLPDMYMTSHSGGAYVNSQVKTISTTKVD